MQSRSGLLLQHAKAAETSLIPCRTQIPDIRHYKNPDIFQAADTGVNVPLYTCSIFPARDARERYRRSELSTLTYCQPDNIGGYAESLSAHAQLAAGLALSQALDHVKKNLKQHDG